MSLSMRWLLASSFLLIAGFFFHLTLVTHWADSELWSLGLARTLRLTGDDSSISYKFFFYSILHLSYLLPLGNIATIEGARVIFALIGLGLLGLTYQVSFLISRNRQIALFSTLLLFTCSFFLSQGFRLRSDLLASVFQLASLAIFLRWINQPTSQKESFWATWVIILLHMLMLSCTPKAIWHLAINSVFFLSCYYSHRSAHTKNFLLLGYLFPGILFLGIFALYSDQFLSAWHFFQMSFHEGPDHPAFFSAKAFFYIIRLLKENILLDLLFLLSIVGWVHSIPFRTALVASSIMVVVAMLFHNDRLSFYILSVLPVLVISISHFLWSFSFSKSKIFQSGLVVLLVVQGIYFWNRFSQENSNEVQIEAIHLLEDYLKSYPGVTYFDANAVMPRSNQVYFFVSPSHEENRTALFSILKSNHFDLIFFSNRMAFYGQEVLDFLRENNYWNLGGGIFGKSQSYGFPGPHKLMTAPTGTFCHFPSPEKPIYFYEGNSFVETKPMTAQSILVGRFKGNKGEAFSSGISSSEMEMKYSSVTYASSVPIIACSQFKPIGFPNGSSFGQIFDVDSAY